MSISRLPQTSFYVNTSAGSGKTHEAIQMMLAPHNEGKNYILVSPTIDLTEQSHSQLLGALEDSNATRKVHCIVPDKRAARRTDKPLADQAGDV
jgi:RecG-like helicase